MEIPRTIRLLILLGCLVLGPTYGQDIELVGVELARFPKDLEIGNASEAGIRIQFFVKDTATVTGLTTTYKLKEWITDSGRDLHEEHQKLANAAVQSDYQMARDTALLSERGFWYEQGKGFVFRFHSWALPDHKTTAMSLKAEIEYSVLVPGEVIAEDITHLAGNIDGLTGFDFKGNAISLKQKTYGLGEEAYMTFSGTVTNKTYQTAIQTMQFLDSEGVVLDELYFGLNNKYNTRTRNRVDLKHASVVRILYRKLMTKKVGVDSSFGLGF